jgi:hypothetical protein
MARRILFQQALIRGFNSKFEFLNHHFIKDWEVPPGSEG